MLERIKKNKIIDETTTRTNILKKRRIKTSWKWPWLWGVGHRQGQGLGGGQDLCLGPTGAEMAWGGWGS